MRTNYCPAVDTTSYYTAWESVRNNYGPKPGSMSAADRTAMYGSDLDEYGGWLSLWNSEHGQAVGGQDIQNTVERFGKWMIWRCANGTSNYGNLQRRIRDHHGLSCAPCPYDSNTSTLRSETTLGFVPDRTDHGNHFMEIAQRGSVWGFECTYSGCSYFLDNGYTYFEV
jgi:hypothetical protein